MSHPSRHLSALVLTLVASPAILMGQGATTSALMGLVRDPQGAPLPGATVRIASSSLIGGEKVMKTTANGSYRFPALPPGLYRITVESGSWAPLSGFEILELGRTSSVNWQFQAMAGATVEVVAATATAAGESTPAAVTQNFTAETLEALPAERNISAIMNLTPGINGSSAWGGMSRNNAYLMDGVNVGDPSGNSQWIYPNMDWFEEIQVGGVGAPAEFGGFTGAFVNTVIKRGGNELKGSINGYYGDAAWVADLNNDDPRLTPEDKKTQPGKDWDVGFNVGGPIIKDKLWYFVSASRTQSETTPVGTTGVLKIENLKAIAKLTWQVIPTATLEGFIEYDTMDEEQRGLDRYTLPIATVQEKSPSRSYNLTWTQTFGSDKVLTLKATGYSGRYDLLPYNGSQPPLDAFDTYNGIEYYNNTFFYDENYRARATFAGIFDWFLSSGKGSHALRMGLEVEQASDEEFEGIPGGIGYTATTLYDPVTGAETGLETYDAMTGGGWNVRARLDRTMAFVQDTWTISDRVSVMPGLRFEQFKGRAYGADTLWSTSTLAPRIGVTIALTADQKHMLKAHWGRYFEGLNTYMFDRAIPGGYPIEEHFWWGAPDLIDPLDPSTWPPFDPTTSYLRIDQYSALDPNIKHPYADASTISYEARFGSQWSGSLTWIHKENKDAVVRVDQAPDPDGFYDSVVNPLTGQDVPVWDTGLYADEHQYLITNDGRSERKYDAWTLGVDKAMANDWSFTASYTKAKLKGNITRIDGYDDVFLNPNTQYNAQGQLPGFHEEEVKGRIVYQMPWKMRIAASYTYLSGERWTPYIRTWYTGPDQAFRARLFATERGAEKYPSRSLLDVRLSQDIPLGKKVNAEVFVEGFNLLNSGAPTAWNTRVNQNYTGTVYADYKLPTATVKPRNYRLGLRVSF